MLNVIFTVLVGHIYNDLLPFMKLLGYFVFGADVRTLTPKYETKSKPAF